MRLTISSLLLLSIPVLAGGCFSATTPLEPDAGVMGEMDAGGLIDPPIDPPVEPPVEPPIEPPVDPPVGPPEAFFRGRMTDTSCDLRGGRSRFVLAPELRACDDVPDEFTEIEVPLLPLGAELRFEIEDPEVRVRSCRGDACVDAVSGALELFVARGEVVRVLYEVRFADGRGQTAEAEVTAFCSDFCPALAEQRGRVSCDVLTGEYLVETGVNDCEEEFEEGVRFRFTDHDALRAGARLRIPDQVQVELCEDERCTDGLEGALLLDQFEFSRAMAGRYVFFASPGTDYSGRFSAFTVCGEVAACL